MLSEKARREEQLSVLQKLKKKGMPERPAEDDMRSMFDLTKDVEPLLAEDEAAARDGEEEEEVVDTEVPYAPGKRMPKKALTPLPVGGGPARPKKKISLT